MAIFTAIASAIVGAVGAVTAAGAVTLFGSAVIGSIAVGVVATGLALGTAKLLGIYEKPKPAGQSRDPGVKVQLPPGTDNKVPKLYGRNFTGGTIIDAELKNRNKTMTYALVLSEYSGETWTVGDIFRDDAKLNFGTGLESYTVKSVLDRNDGFSTALANNIRVRVYAGGSAAQYQIFPANNQGNAYGSGVAQFNSWTSANTMEDLVFAIVEIDYNPEERLTGLGAFTFDLRSDLSNPANVLIDYLTNDRYGAGINANLLELSSFDDLYDYANTDVDYTTQANITGTHKRLSIDGAISTFDTVKDNIDKICISGGCFFTYAGKDGQFGVVTNRAATTSEKNAAFVLDDDNIISKIQINSTELYGIFNSVEVEYPAVNKRDQTDVYYNSTPLAQRNPNEPDNPLSYRLEMVNDRSRVANLSNIDLKQSRLNTIVELEADFSALQINTGEIVKLTAPTYGFNEKLFRAMRITEQESAEGMITVKLLLLEYADSVYDHTVEPEDDGLPLSGIPSIYTINANANLTLGNVAVVDDLSPSATGTLHDFATGSVVGTDTQTNIRSEYNVNYGATPFISLPVTFGSDSTFDAAVVSIKSPTANVDTEVTTQILPPFGQTTYNPADVYHFTVPLTEFNDQSGAIDVQMSIQFRDTISRVASVINTSGNISIDVQNTIDDRLLGNGSVTTDALRDYNILAQKIANAAVSTQQIADGAIETAKLAANAVTQSEIADLAITAEKIAANAVEVDKIAANAVVAGKIAANAVSQATIQDLAINADKIATNAVIVDKIAAGAVEAGKIAANAVIAGKIAANAVSQATIQDLAINADKIATNAVIVDKIAANAVVQGKIAANAVTNQTIVADAITEVKIATDAITETKISNNSITTPKLITGAVVADKIAANAVVAGKIDAAAVTAGTIAASAVTASTIAANAVVAGKINAGAVTAGTIAASAVTATTIAAGAVVADKIATNAVTAVKINASAVEANKIAANAVVAGKIAANAVKAAQIEAGAVIAGKIAAGAVTAGTIAANAVTANEINAGAITADKIATNAVTAVKINAGAVEAAKIAANAVVAGKIDAGAVTAGTISAGAVTATTIATGAVTADKILANAVTANKINAGAVLADKIGAGAVVAGKIGAGAVTAGTIAAGAVTATEINVGQLSAVSGDLGSITAGSLNIGGGAFVVTTGGALTATSASITGTVSASAFTLQSGASVTDVGGQVINSVNKGKTIALLLNQNSDGTTNTGEGSLVGVNNTGSPVPGTDGFFTFSGTAYTVSRNQFSSVTFATQVVNKKGYLAYDLSGANFAIDQGNSRAAFVWKENGQWYYDDNSASPAVSFTPNNNIVALAFINTSSPADATITGGLLAEPVTLVSLSELSADYISVGLLNADRIQIDNVTLDTDGSGSLIVATGGVDTGQIATRAVTNVARAEMASNRIYRTYFDTLATLSSQTFNSGDIAQIAWGAYSWPEVSDAPYLALRILIQKGGVTQQTKYVVGGATTNTSVDAFMSQAIWSSSYEYDIPSSGSDWSFILQARTNTTGNLTNRYFRPPGTFIQTTRLKR